MLDLICYLFPAFISLRIHKSIAKDTKSPIIDYGVYVALDNLATLILIRLMKQGEDSIIYGGSDLKAFAGYLIPAVFFAVIMPLVVKYIGENFAIDIKSTPKETRAERRARKLAEKESRSAEDKNTEA